MAQAVDAVNGSPYGVAYFAAAGNDGSLAYDNRAPSLWHRWLSTETFNTGERLLNFDTTGATTVTSLPVTIASLVPGEFVAIVVQWDQPYVTGAPNSGGATSQIDVCITGAAGNDQIVDENGDPVSCTGPNATGSDPVQIMLIGIPATSSGNSSPEMLNIQVGLVSNGTCTRTRTHQSGGGGRRRRQHHQRLPQRERDGHAAGSSRSGRRSGRRRRVLLAIRPPAAHFAPAITGIVFVARRRRADFVRCRSGTRLAQQVVTSESRISSDPDDGNNTFLGFTTGGCGRDRQQRSAEHHGLLTTNITSCQNAPAKYPNFFGTSAATPHVASIGRAHACRRTPR